MRSLAKEVLFFRWGLLAATLVLLSGCGGGDAALRTRALDHFSRGEFVEAETATLNPKVIEETPNRLLTLLELGSIAHYAGLYQKSNVYFFRAKAVARELYTTSVREQIATGIFNDNSASYVGMEYELSMLHYFIAANFLMQSQQSQAPAWALPEIRVGKQLVLAGESHAARIVSEKDRQQYLVQARAELIDWNAYLREVRERNRGQPYFKDDLLNKVFAAYIHRLVGSTQDENIAKVLYRDAQEILVKAYSAYPSFNNKAESYLDNYAKFEALGEQVVRDKYIDKTPRYITAETEIAASAKKQGNVFLLLEHGMSPIRKEKKYVIGISTLLKEIKDPKLRRAVEEIGVHALLQFAPNLGLAFVGATVVGATTGKSASGDNPAYISEAVDSAIGFEFKVPSMEGSEISESYQVKFSGASQELIEKVALLNPVSDIAKLNVDRRAAEIALKTGIRVGLKYLAALVPAVVAYRQINGPDFVKMLAATAVWIAGKKIVDASEAADLRAWTMLPKWVGYSEVSLPIGTYNVSVFREEDSQTYQLGSINLEPRSRVVLKTRILPNGNIANSSPATILY